MVVNYYITFPFSDLDSFTVEEAKTLNEFYDEWRSFKKYIPKEEDFYDKENGIIIIKGRFQTEVKRETIRFMIFLHKYNIIEERDEIKQFMQKTYSTRTKLSWWDEYLQLIGETGKDEKPKE